MIEKEYTVTGLSVIAVYTEQEVEELFLPLLKKLTALRKKKGSRLVVYLAAPPGAGKTTLSLCLEDLFSEQGTEYTFQSVSMDGFHHYNRYLDRHFIQREGETVRLRKFKGMPETFDFESLKKKITELLEKEVVRWPAYDRLLHDVSEETVKVEADIVLIEGNYLLLDQEPWRELSRCSDYSIFIDTDLVNLEDRLISRKQAGGASFEEAAAHYRRTDKVNAELVLTQSLPANMTFHLTKEGRLMK